MSRYDTHLYHGSTEDFCHGEKGRTSPEAVEALKAELAINSSAIIEGLIPPIYRESESGSLDQTMLSACLAWRMGSRGLGLVGRTGLGKTRSAYGLLRRITENAEIVHRQAVEQDARHYPTHACYRFRIPVIRAVNDATMAKLIMASCAFDDHTEAKERLKTLYSADLLFIDDLGQSRLSERVGAEIYEIVETRTANLKPILFTSNFGGKELAQKFTDTTRGDAVVRRLAEFCEIVRGEE